MRARDVLPDRRTLVRMLLAAALAAGATWALARPTGPPDGGPAAAADSGRPEAPSPRRAGLDRRPWAARTPDAEPAAGGPSGARPEPPAGAESPSAPAATVSPSPSASSAAAEPAAAAPGRAAGAAAPGGSAAASRHRPLREAVFRDLPEALREELATLDDEQRAAVRDVLEDRRSLADRASLLQQENEGMQQQLDDEGLPSGPTPESVAEEGGVDFLLEDVALRDQPLSPVLVEELGLGEEQAAAIEDLIRSSADDLREELQGLLGGMSGDPSTGTDFPLDALVDAIRDGTPSADFEAAVALIAAELRGEVPSGEGSTGTAAEAMLRAVVERQDNLKRQLEKLLGPELTADLLAHPEWKGTRHTYH